MFHQYVDAMSAAALRFGILSQTHRMAWSPAHSYWETSPSCRWASPPTSRPPLAASRGSRRLCWMTARPRCSAWSWSGPSPSAARLRRSRTSPVGQVDRGAQRTPAQHRQKMYTVNKQGHTTDLDCLRREPLDLAEESVCADADWLGDGAPDCVHDLSAAQSVDTHRRERGASVIFLCLKLPLPSPHQLDKKSHINVIVVDAGPSSRGRLTTWV